MDQGITYAPRTAIKSQVLADFMAEWTEVQTPSAPEKHEYWTMHFDGSLMKARAGAGLVFISSLGIRMRYMIRLHFPASNNVAEYGLSSTGFASPSSWASDGWTSEATPS